jgi:hypothetical protein
MTDLIERIEAELALEPTLDRAPADSGQEAPPQKSFTPPGRILLAVMLGCSAILLFLTAAPRFSGWRVGAVALVIAAWVQISLGVSLWAKAFRPVFLWVAGVNVSVAALWAVVLAGHHATTDFAAGTGAALSGAAAVTALLLALRPTLGTTWQSSTLALSSIVPVAVVVITTTALALPATLSSTRAPASRAPAGQPNPFFNSVKVPGQSSARFLQIASGNDSEKAELLPWVPLNPQDQAVLSQQLSEAQQAALRFPTVADAKKAGMILAGGMAPGVGAHYQVISAAALNGVNADGSINPASPGSWIYASTADNAPVVGVMYESFNTDAPAGFAGPNDHWHQHSNLCITWSNGKIGVPFAPDTTVTPQQCATVHGKFISKTLWMVHAWVVPGWESPLGVFSHSNPHVYCPGNTDLTDAIGFCLRQQ